MLLDLITDFCNEFGFPTPTVAIGSTDPLIKQLVAFAQKEGKDLARRHDWQKLTREVTFDTVAASLQVALSDVCLEPTVTNDDYEFDYQRMIDNTMWNRTQNRPCFGPLDATEWQRKQAAAADAGLGNMFRIRNNSIYFFPTPTAGETVYFEYLSKNWCQDTDARGQSRLLADTDTFRIDEELIRLGVVWRFRKSKGLDYGEDFATYERAIGVAWANDGGRTVLDLNDDCSALNDPTIPDGNWPQA